MVHPAHGAKVAISEDEAILDEMYGWERYDIDTPAYEVDDDAAGEGPVNEMAEPKRRGRRRAAQED
jgi:hypothetical protein